MNNPEVSTSNRCLACPWRLQYTRLFHFFAETNKSFFCRQYLVTATNNAESLEMFLQ